jgi:hypothetical protein
VTHEMLSGPDLGGGFLHQLSLDREGELTTFTFHAQEGGSDAGGPAKGPLDVFGFVHPATSCMFGGPRCWHRRFLLPATEAPRVRRAYNRDRFVLDAMVSQAYGGVPAAVRTGLLEVVRRIASVLDAEEVEWYVGGSTSAWLQGAGIVPRDLDLGTTREGVERIAALLGEYLIEPVAPTDWPGLGIVQAARAFVGTFKEGLRVEWAVPIGHHGEEHLGEWSGRPGVARLETVAFEGRPVRVSRAEYALVRAAEKRDQDHVSKILELVRRRGPDDELLETLLARSTLSAADREALERNVWADRAE